MFFTINYIITLIPIYIVSQEFILEGIFYYCIFELYKLLFTSLKIWFIISLHPPYGGGCKLTGGFKFE